MKLKTSHLILETDKKVTESPTKLRGYVGKKFPEYLLLHHHVKDSEYLYNYPKVQYKVIEGFPSIFTIEDGSNVVKGISDGLDELILGEKTYKVKRKVLYEQEFDIKPGNKTKYSFLTPWVGLNSKNHEKYMKMTDWRDKKLLLNNILVGNILSMCKGLGIIVNRRLHVHSRLDPQNILFKGVNLTGFTGEFTVNFKIPDFAGLGKGVSQGFGTVREVEDENSCDL